MNSELNEEKNFQIDNSGMGDLTDSHDSNRRGGGVGGARYKLMSPAMLPISRSTDITIPPGLSPTSFLESPVFISNIKEIVVYLESNHSEVFVHLSPTRCWEMVKDRVNQEISKQHKAGKSDLPPLQPAGSPDGFEMFGYSSPAIVQAIEALDVNRVCTDYWDSRPYSRPQVQFPANSLPREANTSARSLDKIDDSFF